MNWLLTIIVFFLCGCNGQSSSLFHPAGLLGQCQINRLANLSSTSALVAKLSQTTPLDLTLSPSYTLPILSLYSYTSNANYTNQSTATFDGLIRYASRQSYQQTIMYLITGNTKYADNAISIIRNWTSITNFPSYYPNYISDCPTQSNWWMCQNSPLNFGWASVSWFRVAEILKYRYPGWYNSTVEQQLVTWFESNQVETLWKATTLIDPSTTKAQYGMGNWHSTMIEGLMNYYFLKNNVTGLNYVIQYYQRMVNGSNLFPPFYAANGEECELCRDVEHANYGIGSLVQIAESFWHQGIDLYSYGPSGYSGLPGLAQVIETTAYIILNNNWPPNVTSIDLGWGNCTTFLKNTFTPGGFHIGYNHYVNRLGLSMPSTQTLIAAYPDTAYYFNWGLGVLTHTGTGFCDSTLGTSTISSTTISPSASPSSTGISVTTSSTTSKYSTTTMVTGIVASIVLVSVGSIFLVLRKRYRIRQPSATHPPNLQQIKPVFVK